MCPANLISLNNTAICRYERSTKGAYKWIIIYKPNSNPINEETIPD